MSGGDGMEGIFALLQRAALDQILRADLAGQEIGKARRLADGQLVRQGGSAQVAVDEEDPLAQLAGAVGQVDGGQGLAFAGEGTGNANNMAKENWSLVRRSL